MVVNKNFRPLQKYWNWTKILEFSKNLDFFINSLPKTLKIQKIFVIVSIFVGVKDFLSTTA
jgi:hypothetical protein